MVFVTVNLDCHLRETPDHEFATVVRRSQSFHQILASKKCLAADLCPCIRRQTSRANSNNRFSLRLSELGS